MDDSTVFGIDLGTTCSAIGFIDDGRPRLIPIDSDDLVPSVLFFPPGAPDGPPVIGRAALNSLMIDPDRAIRSFKRLMGSDHVWQVGGRSLTPVDASAAVLRKLSDGAEEALGERPRRVVITVPAWFTQSQRADTRRAGELAGLDVVRMINEPTAAALAHAHVTDTRRVALVFDLGGGTFDVSLVRQDGPLVEVLASHGDTRLGGVDFDEALLDVVMGRMADTSPQLYERVQRSPAAQARLSLAVEAAKIELSFVTRTALRVPFLVGARPHSGAEADHLEMEIKREDLEQVIAPLALRTLASVDQVLTDGKLRPTQVDELLLVGGSTRIPMIWDMLHRAYGLEGNAAVAPDRAVALGAAIQAGIVEGGRVRHVLVDVAPYSISIGAETDSGWSEHRHFVCTVVTPRNSSLPSHHSKVLYTVAPRQSSAWFPVFQGADPNPLRNTIIGEIQIRDLPPTPLSDFPRPLTVEFRHDLDGLVHITVTDDLTGRTVKGKVVAGGVEGAGLREHLLEILRQGRFMVGEGREAEMEAEASPAGEREPAIPPSHSPPGPPSLTLVRGGVVRNAKEESESQSESEGQNEHEDEGRAPDDPELADARKTFDSVLAYLATRDKTAGEETARLKRLAQSGLDHLQRGDGDRALDSYEALTDLMFELGVYI